MKEALEQSVLTPILEEYREEVGITRRVLERVPGDKLMWQPHAKSMTLGQLALHVGTIPGGISKLVSQDSFDAAQANFVPPQPKSAEEILSTFEESARDGEGCLSAMSDEKALGPWTLKFQDKEVFTKPRIGIIRTIMLNHWYHHRGQLSVYLRMLDVAVPVIYGRSADENPFG